MLRFLFTSLFAFLIFGWVGCNRTIVNQNPRTSNSISFGPTNQALSKFNLEHLLLGKNRFEVERFMGPADGQSLIEDGDYLYDYRRAVLEDNTGQVYDWSLITFKFDQGIVASIDIIFDQKPDQLLEDDADEQL